MSAGGRNGSPLSARTVTYARTLLHKAFEDAVASGQLLVNPVSRVQRTRRDTEGRVWRYPAAAWTVEELRLFLNLVDTHALGPPLALLATTGMRRGELCALSWDNVDLDRRELVIDRALSAADGVLLRRATKSGQARRIAIGDRAIDAIEVQGDRQRSARLMAGKQWTNPLGLIFTTKLGVPVPPATLTDQWRRLIRKLPLPRIRLHDLRHTHAILLLHAGIPVIDVSHRLGHADPSVTLKMYARALHDPGHAAAECFDRLLDNKLWATTPGA